MILSHTSYYIITYTLQKCTCAEYIMYINQQSNVTAVYINHKSSEQESPANLEQRLRPTDSAHTIQITIDHETMTKLRYNR